LAEGERLVGDAELDSVMAVEVAAHPAANRRTGLYVQSESVAFMVDRRRNAGKKGNFRAA